MNPLLRIDAQDGMPAVEFTGDRCIVTFTVMPTPRGMKAIMEVTEMAIDASNELRLAHGLAPVKLEYRLPVGDPAAS